LVKQLLNGLKIKNKFLKRSRVIKTLQNPSKPSEHIFKNDRKNQNFIGINRGGNQCGKVIYVL